MYRPLLQARDLSQDVTSALNAAFSLVGIQAFLPAGSYAVGMPSGASSPTPLNSPVCAGIAGAGFLTSIIKTAGVALGLSISGSNDMVLQDFGITGDATSSARGIVFGDTAAPLNNVLARNLWITGFTGPGAVGIDVRSATELTLLNCRSMGNTLNGRCKAGSATTLLPQRISFPVISQTARRDFRSNRASESAFTVRPSNTIRQKDA